MEWEDLIRNKSTFSKFYWYDEDSEEQEAKLSGKLKVIYNGVYYFEALLSDLLPNVGDVTLIDNNQDDIYDIIVVNDYQLVYVSHTNTNTI